MVHTFAREICLRQCSITDIRHVSNGFYAHVADTAAIPVSMLESQELGRDCVYFSFVTLDPWDIVIFSRVQTLVVRHNPPPTSELPIFK
jgi:hypothetical protein